MNKYYIGEKSGKEIIYRKIANFTKNHITLTKMIWKTMTNNALVIATKETFISLYLETIERTPQNIKNLKKNVSKIYLQARTTKTREKDLLVMQHCTQQTQCIKNYKLMHQTYNCKNLTPDECLFIE